MTQTNNQGEKVNVSPYKVPEEKNDHYDIFETYVRDDEEHFVYWCSVANEDKAEVLAEALAVYAAVGKTISNHNEPLPKMVVRSRPTKAHTLHKFDAKDLIPFNSALLPNFDFKVSTEGWEEPEEYSHVPAELARQIFQEDVTEKEAAVRMGAPVDFHWDAILVDEGNYEDMVHPSNTPEAIAKREARAAKRAKKEHKHKSGEGHKKAKRA